MNILKKHLTWFSTAVLLIWVNKSILVAQTATLYVSTQGQWGWSGRFPEPNKTGTDGPLPSIAAARDRLRTLSSTTSRWPRRILIRGGNYFLPETFQLGPNDSGTKSAPVIYAAYPGEHPVISGGRAVRAWKQIDHGIWEAEYKTPITQLFINGNRAMRVRVPLDGFYRIEGPSSTDAKFLLHYRGDDIKPEWANSGAEVVILLAWAETRRPIISVDPVRHIATLAGPARPTTHEESARYWVENTPTDLNTESEWEQDLNRGVIHYKPRAEEDVTQSEFVAPYLPNLVMINGDPASGRLVHDIEFRGLTFRHTAWVLPPGGFYNSQASHESDSAFQAIGARRIRIEDCSFSALGGYAIHLRRGSSENTIARNAFFDLGGGGIRIGEESLPEKDGDQARGNVVSDNELHDLGVVYPSAAGIWVGQSSNNDISHNHIHHLKYSGISVGWTWGYKESAAHHNTIAFNRIHDIEGMSDLGGIYVLGPQPGTVIRNNVISNISGFTYGGWGVYLDEGVTNVLVDKNIVYDTKSSSVEQHFGRDNIISNNILAFGANFQIARTVAEQHLSFTFEHNIVLFDQGYVLGYNWEGSGYRMDKNIYWDLRGEGPRFANMAWKEWQSKGNDAHSICADPKFVSPRNYNFRFQADSPAWRMGIRPISTADVGPRPYHFGTEQK